MKYENEILAEVSNSFPNTSELTVNQVATIAKKFGVLRQSVYNRLKRFDKVGVRAGQAVFNLESALVPFRSQTQSVQKAVAANVGVTSVSSSEVFVPEVDTTFVRWGNFSTIKKIIGSGMFYPTFVTGLSGNGKTFMIEQACAQAGREYVRVQISPETDEDDLIGGFRLIQGETVFQKGPVIKAMEQGAILLIDEIDRGTNKIMALQGVLEGKPVLIKKTGEVVKPAKGFNVISTANTKGKGSEDGRFAAATIIDEAFLERFTITVEQTFPQIKTETKILEKHMEKFSCVDEEFATYLVNWADAIRKTYADDGVDEVISTRRLCHIVQTFAIFNDKMKAVELCINRFDEDTKEAFLDLYSKVDVNAVQEEAESVDI